MELTEQEQKKVAALIKADADIAAIQANLAIAGFENAGRVVSFYAGKVSREVALFCGRVGTQYLKENGSYADYFSVYLPSGGLWVSVDGVYNAEVVK